MYVLIRSTILFIFISLFFPVHAEMKNPIELLQVIIPFQVCVDKTLDEEYALKKILSKKSLKKIDIENSVFQMIIDQCGKHIGSKAQDVVRIHYEGNNSKANGFIEGVIYSARVRSVIRSDEYIGN